MAFILIDGVIANDTFSAPAAAGNSVLVDGINNQDFQAAATAWTYHDWLGGMGMIMDAQPYVPPPAGSLFNRMLMGIGV